MNTNFFKIAVYSGKDNFLMQPTFHLVTFQLKVNHFKCVNVVVLQQLEGILLVKLTYFRYF